MDEDRTVVSCSWKSTGEIFPGPRVRVAASRSDGLLHCRDSGETDVVRNHHTLSGSVPSAFSDRSLGVSAPLDPPPSVFLDGLVSRCDATFLSAAASSPPSSSGPFRHSSPTPLVGDALSAGPRDAAAYPRRRSMGDAGGKLREACHAWNSSVASSVPSIVSSPSPPSPSLSLSLSPSLPRKPAATCEHRVRHGSDHVDATAASPERYRSSTALSRSRTPPCDNAVASGRGLCNEPVSCYSPPSLPFVDRPSRSAVVSRSAVARVTDDLEEDSLKAEMSHHICGLEISGRINAGAREDVGSSRSSSANGSNTWRPSEAETDIGNGRLSLISTCLLDSHSNPALTQTNQVKMSRTNHASTDPITDSALGSSQPAGGSGGDAASSQERGLPEDAAPLPLTTPPSAPPAIAVPPEMPPTSRQPPRLSRSSDSDWQRPGSEVPPPPDSGNRVSTSRPSPFDLLGSEPSETSSQGSGKTHASPGRQRRRGRASHSSQSGVEGEEDDFCPSLSPSPSPSPTMEMPPCDCDDCVMDGEDGQQRHQGPVTLKRQSSWKKIRSIIKWSPFIQVFKKHRYPWIQLAGHQGNFQAGDAGSVLKKLDPREHLCFTEVMNDTLRPYVPEFSGIVEKNGEKYLKLQDLLCEYTTPWVMDIKMGIRTYLEEELEKARKKPTLRKDMYKKMVEVEPTAPTEEEHAQKAVTKPRYMQWRDEMSSSVGIGYRIEGIKRKDGDSSKDFKKTRTKDQVESILCSYIGDNQVVLAKYIRRLKAIRATQESSEFFRTHEVIGSSLLFVHDSSDNANVWIIDFGKTIPLPKNVIVDHRSPWIEGNHEDGYLYGMDNLIATLEKLSTS